MRDIYPPPAPTPTTQFRGAESVQSSANGSVRAVSPEDVYDDRYAKQPTTRPQSYHDLHASMRQNERENPRFTQSTNYPSASSSRQISTTSSATTAISGSENWESYASDEEEPDASDAYYVRPNAAHGKRFTPDDGYSQGNIAKKQRGVPPYEHAGHAMTDAQGNRVVSGSEANWTDDDAF